MANTPPSWPVQIFGIPSVLYGILNDKVLKILMDEGRLFFTNDDFLQTVKAASGINRVLTNPTFWRQVRGDKILFFQTDAIMCANGPASVVEFMENFDWVGSPWNQDWNVGGLPGKDLRVGNGGFSVRNRTLILDVLNSTPYQETVPEDYWYSYHIPLMGGKVPSFEHAQEFGVEMTFYPKPIGVHKFWWHLPKDTYGKLVANCPPLRAIGPEP
jgi:hypothetical protein